MKQFLQELELKQKKYVVFYDSQNAINLSKNTLYHSHTKHIDVRYHWLWPITKEKLMVLNKIHMEQNVVTCSIKAFLVATSICAPD